MNDLVYVNSQIGVEINIVYAKKRLIEGKKYVSWHKSTFNFFRSDKPAVIFRKVFLSHK